MEHLFKFENDVIFYLILMFKISMPVSLLEKLKMNLIYK